MLIFNIHTQMKIIFLLLLRYILSCICYFKLLADKFYILLQLQKQGTGKYYSYNGFHILYSPPTAASTVI